MLVDVTTWHLEMLEPSQLRASPAPPDSVELRQAQKPTPELGRYLYTAAGGNWFWCDRLVWTYDRWIERFASPRVEVWVMYTGGTPAGFFELDGTVAKDVEIAYFGLMPQYLGRNLGGWLLSESIRRGWAMGAERVWVHTCSLDAQPQALTNYKARGMRVFKEVTEPVEVPEITPGPWPGAGVRGPHMVIEKGWRMSQVEERLAALGHKLWVPGAPIANFVNAVRTGNLVYLAGQGPRKEDGQYTYIGKVGKDIDVATAQKSAELVMLNCLSVLKQEIGDLDRVKRVVKLLGMVNCTPDFTDQPKVINGASDLLVAAFGDAGRHARSAVGMSSLPLGISVEIEMIVEVA